MSILLFHSFLKQCDSVSPRKLLFGSIGCDMLKSSFTYRLFTEGAKKRNEGLLLTCFYFKWSYIVDRMCVNGAEPRSTLKIIILKLLRDLF
jgi:hypothetical protein